MNHTISLTLRPDSLETVRLRRSEKLTGLPLALTLLLLLTAACGDLQDPATGSSAHITAGPDAQTPYLTKPSPDLPSQELPYRPALIPTPADPGFPGSDPAQSNNPSTIDDQLGSQTSSQSGTSTNVSPSEQLVNTPAGQTGANSILRRVTLVWDPSASGNSDGYRVSVRSDSTVSPYYYDAGPATQLTVSLLAGTRYWFTVLAYNAAGESPPSEEFSFTLN